MDNFIWENIYIEAVKAGTLKNVSNWKMIKVEVKAKDNALIMEGCENVELPKGFMVKK